MASFLVCLLLSTASAFAPPRSSPLHSHLAATSTPDVVVISPPGGIGEITSLEAAKTGSSVKWFVVSSSASKPLALTSDSLAAIEAAGGSLEFAGADAESLVFADDDSSNSATAAVSTWCSGTKAVLCTYDGAEEEGRRADRSLGDDAGVGAEKAKMIRSGVRVAARQAAGAASSGARKVIALYSDEEMSSGADEMKEDKKGFLGDLFGKGGKGVPETLKEALDGSVNVVRYGELFGAAESSVSKLNTDTRPKEHNYLTFSIFLPMSPTQLIYNQQPKLNNNLSLSHLLLLVGLGPLHKFVKCTPCAPFA